MSTGVLVPVVILDILSGCSKDEPGGKDRENKNTRNWTALHDSLEDRRLEPETGYLICQLMLPLEMFRVSLSGSRSQLQVCQQWWRERILPAAMNRLESLNIVGERVFCQQQWTDWSLNGTEKTKFCVKLTKRSDSVNFVRSRRCCSWYISRWRDVVLLIMMERYGNSTGLEMCC